MPRGTQECFMTWFDTQHIDSETSLGPAMMPCAGANRNNECRMLLHLPCKGKLVNKSYIRKARKAFPEMLKGH
jgi:hypothetical protein